MTLAILFWCYKEAGVCESRLRLLRHYNSNAPIYVLFGGAVEEAASFQVVLNPYINDFYTFPVAKSSLWRWKHGDILIARWFQQRGSQLEWDTIAVVQGDMLVFSPVGKLFKNLKEDELLLSGLRPIAEVKGWWPWVKVENEYYSEYTTFLDKNGFEETDAWCCLFIIVCLPRAFLQRFAARKHPEIGFLEYTIPTCAKAWGFKFCIDHAFVPWAKANPATKHYSPYRKMLNAVGEMCPNKYILLHLLNPLGLRVFHPYCQNNGTRKLLRHNPAWLNFLWSKVPMLFPGFLRQPERKRRDLLRQLPAARRR